MRFFRAVLFSAAGFLCALPAWATGSTDSAAISAPLQVAVRAAWENSPDLQAALAEKNAVEARSRAAAQPLYNPSLALEAENADVDRRTVGVSMPLDLSGKRGARTEEGRAQLRASEAACDAVRRDIAGRWLKAWASATLADRQSALGARRVDLMKRFDEQAAARLKAGDVSSPERDLAGLALGEALIQRATLVGNEAATRASLRAISGDEVGELPSMPVGALPAASVVSARSVDELPELREARAHVDSADAGTRVARLARIPDPTVSLTGGRVRSGPFDDRIVGVNVSIPIMVRNSGRAEVDAASASADAAAASLQSRRYGLRAAQEETRARYDALQSAVVAFGLGRAGAFDDRVAILEKLWRAGEITTSDYLVQLKQSVDTALSALELQSQTWQAWFDYLAAAGRLSDWVNGLNTDGAP